MKLNIASVFEVVKHADRSAAADNVETKNLGKMFTLTQILDANAKNQHAPKNTVNVSKMEKNVDPNVSALIVVMLSEFILS